MARADQQHDLPLCPRFNMIGVQVEHADKTELQTEPEQLDDDPEQEVALESHLPRHRILPQRAVDAEVTSDWRCWLRALRFSFRLHFLRFHPPTAEYFLIPRAQATRAI